VAEDLEVGLEVGIEGDLGNPIDPALTGEGEDALRHPSGGGVDDFVGTRGQRRLDLRGAPHRGDDAGAASPRNGERSSTDGPDGAGYDHVRSHDRPVGEDRSVRRDTRYAEARGLLEGD
jgi:hypothetical protein